MGCRAGRHVDPVAHAPPQASGGAVSSAWSPEPEPGPQAPPAGRVAPPQFGVGKSAGDDKASGVSCATTVASSAAPSSGPASEPPAVLSPSPSETAEPSPGKSAGPGAGAVLGGSSSGGAPPMLEVLPTSPASSSGSAATPLSSMNLSAGLGAGGLQLPSAEERMQAYQKYRNRRQSHGKAAGRGAGKKLFLSNVPEVEADIPFRFSFMVMGPAALSIIQSACDSPAAQAMQQERSPNLATLLTIPACGSEGEGMDASPSSGVVGSALSTGSLPAFHASSLSTGSLPPLCQSNSNGSWVARASSVGGSRNQTAATASFRCLCPVGPPPRHKGSEGEEQPEFVADRLAKLQFQALDLAENVPTIFSRSEALSSVVVFALWVDDPADMPGGAGIDELSFEESLEAVDKAVRRMRSRTKARLRPVRALLLCQRPISNAPPSDRWAASLSDFESKNGYIWKFGPVRPDLNNSVYAAFAEMAASRAAARDAMAEDGGEDEVEQGEEDGEDALEPGEMLEQSFASQGRRPSLGSECGSECSEGWQLPPRFDTERSGTDVSEGELDLHAKCLKNANGGMSRQVSTGSNYSVYSHPVPQWGSERSGSEVGDSTLEMHARAFGPLVAMHQSETPSPNYGTEQTDPGEPTYTTDASTDSIASTAPSRQCVSATPSGPLAGFRTEQSGSSVSTSALELHNATFGGLGVVGGVSPVSTGGLSPRLAQLCQATPAADPPALVQAVASQGSAAELE